MQKKWFKGMAAVMAAAALAGAFAGCGGDKKAASGSADAGKTVKLGFITAYTGPGAAYGVAMKEGTELAVEEINKDPNTKVKIDLKVYDTKLVKNEAINAMKKCIEQDKVLAIEGPMTTGEAMAADPIAQQSKVAVFGTGTTGPKVTEIGDYVFRNAIPGKMNIPQVVEKAQKKLGFKKIAIMYSNNNDQMVGEHQFYLDACKKLGLEVVADETFADKDTDFSAQLTKIQAANPDVIAIAGLYQEGALIVKKAREMGMNQYVLAGNGFNSPEYIKQAGEAADRTVVATPWNPERKTDKAQNFRKAYVANTVMNRISSLRRHMMRCMSSIRQSNSPVPPPIARNSAIPWLRSATSKALPVNSHSMKTAIRRWTSQSSKSRAASGYRSENKGRLFRYPLMFIHLG